ncbi:MAG TPA: tetratricopeptide repeat protein [Terracidiphilus sp.]|jgi:tetratricopeptide (TPR) repeat protein
MQRIEKTVFLSYRRTHGSWALLVYKNLVQHGFDVFFDYKGIGSGDFEQIIVQNIKSRAHFVVLLAPTALERCVDPGDWVRREIETALETGRNIIPLQLDGFDFATVERQLTGSLARLKQYNAPRIHTDFFDEGMDRLRTQFLNVPLSAVLHPASAPARRAATALPTLAQILGGASFHAFTAEQIQEQAMLATDVDEKIRLFTEALQLESTLIESLINRGLAWKAKGEVELALKDFTEAIRIKADCATAYGNRAETLLSKDDLAGALQDYNRALAFEPENIWFLLNRGATRGNLGDKKGKLQDYNQAALLEPDNVDVLYNRGRYHRDEQHFKAALRDFNKALRIRPDAVLVLMDRGKLLADQKDPEGAMRDFNEAIRLSPDLAEGYWHRGLVRSRTGDKEGALQDYDEAIRIAPDKPEPYWSRGCVRDERGDSAGAEQDFNEAERLEGK